MTTKKQRARSELRRADQTAFVRTLESRLSPVRSKFFGCNIRPPSDYQFAHGVLSGYVAGLSGEEK